MEEELEAYYFGRKRLAEMMGEDPETFTDKDVEVCIYVIKNAGCTE